MRRQLTSLLIATSVVVVTAPRAQELPRPIDAEVSCRTCHPGAVRGLARSIHAVLLERPDLVGKACASCHGDLAAHASAAGQGRREPTLVAAVTQSSCTTCHADHDYAPARGGHALQHVGSGAMPPPPPDTARLERIERLQAEPAIDWSGFAELGYRLVHHEGSRSAFRTDLDLEPGLRLREFELRGTGSEAAPITSVTASAHDLGDPRWGVDLSVREGSFATIDSRYRRSSFVHDTSSDFHRVDRNTRSWSTTMSLGDDSWQVFGSHLHRDEDGFWLTQRIGDRNLPVQTVVDGVMSPRQRRTEEAEFGVRGRSGALRWTAAAGFTDERAIDRWLYSQPATANPGFAEGEDLTSRTTMDGPTARIGLADDAGGLTWELTGIYRDLRRDLTASGTGQGYDTAAFDTTTTSRGSGTARLWSWQLDAGLELSDTLRVVLAARYRDYEERHRLAQTDVQTTPSSNTVVTTTTNLDDDTVQRLFDGDLQFVWQPTPEFEASLGYGVAREQLRVPSLNPADPLDFRRGNTRDDGVLAGLTWRPCEEWTVRAEGRDFATDGLPLHELVPERARQANVRIGWERDATSLTAFARHRHNDNDVSGHRLDSTSTGLHGSLGSDGTTFQAGYTWSRTEARTRTNFYFDPDPNPQPTLVGFDGETHTWQATVQASPGERLTAELGAVVTRTTGSFALDSSHLRAELRWQCFESGAAGIEWRHMRYDDDHGTDNWAADLIFLFWRHEW